MGIHTYVVVLVCGLPQDNLGRFLYFPEFLVGSEVLICCTHMFYDLPFHTLYMATSASLEGVEVEDVKVEEVPVEVGPVPVVHRPELGMSLGLVLVVQVGELLLWP